MRRRAGVLAAAGTALTLSAGALAYAGTGWDVRTAPAGSTEAAKPASLLGHRTAARPAPQSARRERIGAVEPVRRLLRYTGSARSTTLRYPGASYVKVHFDRLLLAPGDHVTVADPSRREAHRYDPVPPGRGTEEQTGLARGGRWAMSVSGDTAVVTIHRAGAALPGSAPSRLGVGIDKVARGYPRPERRPTGADPGAGSAVAPGAADGAREESPRAESVCGSDDKVDAVCYRTSDPVAYTRSRAVVRLLINGVELCTGWRVGAGNRLLTNNHCFSRSHDAYQTEVWFNYACASCGGYTVSRPTKVWGDRVLATHRELDFTLFTVENFSRVRKFGYLLLDPRRPAAGDRLYLPQHPGGEPTVIAMGGTGRAGNCAVADPRYDGYATDSDVSYYCDTEGGSSGSPVLSRDTDRVVALHHFGGCPNSGVRADLIYARIKRRL